MRKSDSFTAFCLDYLEEDQDGEISKKELRQRYSKYCRKFKLKGSSDKAIKVILENLFGVVDEYKSILLSGKDRENIWIGIKWKSQFVEDVNGFPENLGNHISKGFPETPNHPTQINKKWSNEDKMRLKLANMNEPEVKKLQKN